MNFNQTPRETNDIEALAEHFLGPIQDVKLAKVVSFPSATNAETAFQSNALIFGDALCPIFGPTDAAPEIAQSQKTELSSEPEWKNHATNLTKITGIVRKAIRARIEL